MVTLRLKHALLALIAAAVPALAGEPKTAVLDVPSMFCSLCPVTVRKALMRVPGVLEAKADLATKRAEAKYDPDKVSAGSLAKAVSDAGFPATLRQP
jgi:mercuric ion binding protein